MANSTVLGSLNGTFTGIQSFVGSVNTTDQIRGTNVDDTFHVNGWNSGDVNGILFCDVENLDGGAGNDTFFFDGIGELTGGILGGVGNDSLDFSGFGSAVTVTFGINTSATNLPSFSGIESLAGSTGSDTIVGAAAGSIFNVTGPNAVTVGSLGFTSFENLTGAAGALNDILDFTTYTTPRSVTLTGLGTSDGFAGLTDILSGGFDNINELRGSSSLTGDTFTGMDRDRDCHDGDLQPLHFYIHGRWTYDHLSRFEN